MVTDTGRFKEEQGIYGQQVSCWRQKRQSSEHEHIANTTNPCTHHLWTDLKLGPHSLALFRLPKAVGRDRQLVADDSPSAISHLWRTEANIHAGIPDSTQMQWPNVGLHMPQLKISDPNASPNRDFSCFDKPLGDATLVHK